MVEINVQNGDIAKAKGDAIIVNLLEGVRGPGGATGAVDFASDFAISKQIMCTNFQGDLGSILTITDPPNLSVRHLIVVGLGPFTNFDYQKIRQASAAAVSAAISLGCLSISSIVHGSGIIGLDIRRSATETILGAIDAARAVNTKINLNIVEIDEKKVEVIKKVAGEITEQERPFTASPSML